MLEIQLENIGRRFNRDWIFRNLDYAFRSGERYAILGPNGAGKSTLLRVISGSLTPSEGRVIYQMGGQESDPESIYREVSLAAPYMELIEEFSLRELLRFHFRHKKVLPGFDEAAVTEYIDLGQSMDKSLRFFSSGMKQRVKLALACFSQSQLLLLDEPIVNLDRDAIEWYHRLLEDTVGERLLIICSNQEEEYASCTQHLTLGRETP